MTARPQTVTFSQIDKGDLPLVGGKGANLGEMVKAGFPVPGGFAVTIHAYDDFIKDNNLEGKINEILKGTDVNDPNQLQDASGRIKALVRRGHIPKEVINDVTKAYNKLSGKFGKVLVAVRSSATAEDLPEASFAGQQATYLNIKGHSNLLEAVRNCWASLFTSRAIFYREQNKIVHKNVKISVIVQKMIQSEVSGVMFSIDPVTNEKDRVVIEAVWGLGELIVQGAVVPDRYTVQKDTFTLLSKQISDQNIQLKMVKGVTKEYDVPKKLLGVQKITDEEVSKLAKYAQDLQKHYYFPQDIEWAKEGNDLYILQTRPVTTIKTKTKKENIETEDYKVSEAPILQGASASPGIGTGHVKIVMKPKNIGKIKSGDVLVSEMTSPDFVPAMKKASAIVTDKGGQTSHAAIVSRELGIPCVVGTKNATKKLKDGHVITVDGSKGYVFAGSKVKIENAKQTKKKYPKRNTATKIYVNLAEPEFARKVARRRVDGVGLLRAEFMIADIGIHPKEAIKQKKQGAFVEKLEKGMTSFCRAFYPRPVVYRTTDFKTNEYRALKGGIKWEPKEPNPMLGYRGALRYISDPEVFTLELRAIKNVLKKYNNLWIMIPFVRSPEELAKIRKMVAIEGLFDHTSFKFWMMVELPINVIMIEKFIDVGIDGVSIGSNDLTMLITGTDRDNQEVAQSFNERSKAVLWSLKRTIKRCNKHGVTSSICGQAPSTYEDLVEKLVDYGVTSISVNPDAIDRVRNVVYEAEKRKLK